MAPSGWRATKASARLFGPSPEGRMLKIGGWPHLGSLSAWTLGWSESGSKRDDVCACARVCVR
eukprot:2506969-Pyramimonas_sp.AAC.1